MTPEPAKPMPFEDLEQTYAALAQAIDRAGRDNEALFLTKLALLLAHEIGTFGPVQYCITAALSDMPPAKTVETP
jgi:hypothetical protein